MRRRMSEEKPTVSNDVGDQIGISAISEGIDLAAAIVHEFDQFGDDEAQGAPQYPCSADELFEVRLIDAVEKNQCIYNSSPSAFPRKHMNRSSVWKFYIANAQDRVQCLLCEQSYSSKTSTFTLRRHIQQQHQELNDDVPREAKKISNANLDREFFNFFSAFDIPFKAIESPEFNILANSMRLSSGAFETPTCYKLSNQILDEVYGETRKVIHEKLMDCSYITLSTGYRNIDNGNKHLFCVAANAVSCLFGRVETIMTVKHLSQELLQPADIKDVIMNAFVTINTDAKIMSLTTENSQEQPVAAELMDIPHVPCLRQSIDNIIMKTLSTFQEELSHVRRVALEVQKNESFRNLLTREQFRLGKVFNKIPIDTNKRWTSTAIMLEKYLEQAASLRTLSPDASKVPQALDNLYTVISSALKNAASVVNYARRNKSNCSEIIPLVKLFRVSLAEQAQSSNNKGEVVNKFLNSLLSELDEYLKETERNTFLMVASLFDPRFAFNSNIEEEGFWKKCTNMAIDFWNLFIERSSRKRKLPEESLSTSESDGCPLLFKSIKKKVESAANIEQELRSYQHRIMDNLPDFWEDPDYAPAFWISQCDTFPSLNKMASIFLSAPSSSLDIHKTLPSLNLLSNECEINNKEVEKRLFVAAVERQKSTDNNVCDCLDEERNRAMADEKDVNFYNVVKQELEDC